jgi:hypothetical protein
MSLKKKLTVVLFLYASHGSPMLGMEKLRGLLSKTKELRETVSSLNSNNNSSSSSRSIISSLNGSSDLLSLIEDNVDFKHWPEWPEKMEAQKKKSQKAPDCAVCHDDEKGPLLSLDCDPRHRFHGKCISDWFDQQRKNRRPASCPTCKKERTSIDMSKIILYEKLCGNKLSLQQIVEEVEQIANFHRIKRKEAEIKVEHYEKALTVIGQQVQSIQIYKRDENNNNR